MNVTQGRDNHSEDERVSVTTFNYVLADTRVNGKKDNETVCVRNVVVVGGDR